LKALKYLEKLENNTIGPADGPSGSNPPGSSQLYIVYQSSLIPSSFWLPRSLLDLLEHHCDLEILPEKNPSEIH